MHRALLDLALPMFILACLPSGVMLYEERTTLHGEFAELRHLGHPPIGGAAREGSIARTPDGVAALFAARGKEDGLVMAQTGATLDQEALEYTEAEGAPSILVTESKNGPLLWVAYTDGKPGAASVNAFVGPALDRLEQIHERNICRKGWCVGNELRGKFVALEDGALLLIECAGRGWAGSPSGATDSISAILYGGAGPKSKAEYLEPIETIGHLSTAPIDAITLSSGTAVLVALPVESRTSDGERSGQVLSYRVCRGTSPAELTWVFPSERGTTYGTPQLARTNDSYFALIPYESWTTHRGRSVKHHGQVLASKPDGHRVWKNVSSRLPQAIATKATNVRLAADGNSLTFAYTLPDTGRDTPSYHWLAVTSSHDAGHSWSSVKRVKDSAPFAVGTVPVDLVVETARRHCSTSPWSRHPMTPCSTLCTPRPGTCSTQKKHPPLCEAGVIDLNLRMVDATASGR